jgi:hypothetical protein
MGTITPSLWVFGRAINPVSTRSYRGRKCLSRHLSGAGGFWGQCGPPPELRRVYVPRFDPKQHPPCTLAVEGCSLIGPDHRLELVRGRKRASACS